MQLIPPQPNNYVPLISILPLALASAPPLHIFLFAVLLLIRPNATENYCNAIISVLLCLILLLDNFYTASIAIFEYSSSSLMKMQGRVLLDWRIWVYIFQATFLIIWMQYCYKKYKEYKAESML